MSDDTLIKEAVRLLNDHERTKQACLDFLKQQNYAACDPISLKLWIADREMALAKEGTT